MKLKNQYYLVYNGSEYVTSGGAHTGQVSTTSSIKLFDTEEQMQTFAYDNNIVIPPKEDEL